MASKMNLQEVFEKLKTNTISASEETIRILVKIADNILNNPNNIKVRCLLKSNSTVRNKILASKGGLECLILMGFQESDTSFTMPSNSPTDKLNEIRTALLNLKMMTNNKGAIPKTKTKIDSSNASIYEDNNDLKNVKQFVLPSFTSNFANPFLRRLATQFHHALAFDDKACQSRAKTLIPLDRLEVNAQKNLRFVQTKIKKEQLTDPEFSMQDMLLLELLTWFKEEFFTWVDTPPCRQCGGKTEQSHMSTDADDLVYSKRVEVYRCQFCQQFTKFPRYNDLNILLETRRGRCGEWAQVFTLMCRSLDWDARYVIDEQDHVWTEVYSVTQKRWVHCDSCENACDTPLMYENGWNKKLNYIIAYSPEEVQDVTWRYTSNHAEILKRRKSCTEIELVNALITLRQDRQKRLSKFRKSYLDNRLINELVELMVEKKPNDNEKQGRISGSEAWRSARGETSENLYVWRINKSNIINNKLTIRYSTAVNVYEFERGDDSVVRVSDWQFGVYEFEKMFRKEEKDWKVVYLARNEGAEQGKISWRVELENTKKVIDTITLKLHYQTFENGVVDIKLLSDDITLDFPKSDEDLLTRAFSGKNYFIVEATLSGGKGNVAWQHTQLFRQSVDSTEFPFVITVTFK